MTLAQLRRQANYPVGDEHTWPGQIGLMSITLEDGDFLYALTRTVRPTTVIEIGTGVGISGVFIAAALADNGHGHLDTYETKKEYADQARQRLAGLPATVHDGVCHEHGADLVYVDSGAPRNAEIARWLNGDRGLVVVHDAMREYPEFKLGDGVLIPGLAGFWIGRGRPTTKGTAHV